MSDSNTVRLQRCLDRLRDGDASARDDLLRHACERLERLAHKMLHDYRGVRRWEETGDVLQNALVRLSRALDSVTPPTVRDFYRLAAVQLRRELIDLARHHYGPQGQGANHATQPPSDPAKSAALPAHERAADTGGDPTGVLAWSEFHDAAGKLPDEEREVFELLWYQGLKQEDAAELIGVTVRTVKSRWRSARLRLHEALGGELPEI